MARYLERIVARAGIPTQAAAVAPIPRAQFAHDAVDPFESTAHWSADAPARPIRENAQAPSPPSAQPRPAAASAPVSFDSHTTEVHIHPRPQESVIPRAPLQQTLSEPAPLAHEKTAREIEIRPAPRDILEREIRTESVREQTTIERGIPTGESHGSVISAPQNPMPKASDVERKVLAKLMPMLDAWFASDSAAKPPVPQAGMLPGAPVIAPPQRDPQPTSPAATDGPSLVIGSIHVEVASPAGPPPAPPRRVRAARSSSGSSPQRPSRYRFGLGQI